MTLEEQVLELDYYIVNNPHGIVAICNGEDVSFGKNENPEDYMNKEVRKIRVQEGMYADYTIISI